MIRRYAGTFARASGPLMWSKRSYSQEGEDLVVDRLLGGMAAGFYVDIGSHHPFRFSNTYLLYRRQWQGICIDPLPGSARLFRRWRPRDICVEMGVSRMEATLSYHMFNEPALNTFDADLARARDGAGGYHMTGIRKIKTIPLMSILDKFMPAPSRKIDLLSVDVEGLDLQVLESNDWDRFSPTIVIAECLGSTLDSLIKDPIASFLSGLGYSIYAKTGHSVIFWKP